MVLATFCLVFWSEPMKSFVFPRKNKLLHMKKTSNLINTMVLTAKIMIFLIFSIFVIFVEPPRLGGGGFVSTAYHPSSPGRRRLWLVGCITESLLTRFTGGGEPPSQSRRLPGEEGWWAAETEPPPPRRGGSGKNTKITKIKKSKKSWFLMPKPLYL